jgi:predicted secreted hydrolase
MLLFLAACTSEVEPFALACPEPGPAQVELPSDDAVHDEDVEWFYWTGHLLDTSGRWYGFEHTVFVYQMPGYTATSAHMALTDVSGDSFEYEVAYEHGELPQATVDGFELRVEGSLAEGGGGADHLEGNTESASWTLDLAGLETVLQHGDGYHAYEEGGYTWYYSRPRMTVAGELVIDGGTRQVSGQAWFDHQWGELGGITTEGWDWFALQLDDGREVMLFLTHFGGLVGGSVSSESGTCELLEDEFEVVETGTWTSPNTGCTYPMGWEIRIGEETFTLTSVREDQELASDYRTYWEGAVTLDGSETGRGYVEMAGRCE